MKIGNWISVVSIIVSLIIAISSWIYTAWTMWKNNRPSVIIAIRHYRLANFMNRYLIIKNYGKTTADIKFVTSEWVTGENEKIDLSIWQDITLAPNQDDVYYLPDWIEGKLKIKVKYSRHNSLSKSGQFNDESEFNINKENDIELRVKNDKGETNYLAEIARSIQELKK